jgi:hypothetical protein
MNVPESNARAVAAGACALLAEGDEDAAQTLLHMHLLESIPRVGVVMTLQELVSAFLGVSVSVVRDAEKFREYAAWIASSSGETV